MNHLKDKDDKKMIIILGPTSCGKSDLAVQLAKKFNGEIISADSRQVYKQMDIGSGKITKKEMRGIPHHLLSIASPKRNFSANRFQKLAQKEIIKIWRKNKLPIICGGTAFYIDSLLGDIQISPVKPNLELRKRLEKLSAEKLFNKLKKMDSKRAKNIDRKNKRRLIRAIEIAMSNIDTKKIEKKFISKNNYLKIGIKKSHEELKKRIKHRLNSRLKKGMINEVKNLKKIGLSWQRIDNFGLEYRFVSRYLRGIITKKEMIEKILSESWKFVKRQMTWWKRDQNIIWISDYPEAKKIIDDFLRK